MLPHELGFRRGSRRYLVNQSGMSRRLSLVELCFNQFSSRLGMYVVRYDASPKRRSALWQVVHICAIFFEANVFEVIPASKRKGFGHTAFQLQHSKANAPLRVAKMSTSHPASYCSALPRASPRLGRLAPAAFRNTPDA